ncbi:MAG TPA: hypothetical protein VFR02_09420 [bacterium]|nr:hypothetical protein [bacterium]
MMKAVWLLLAWAAPAGLWAGPGWVTVSFGGTAAEVCAPLPLPPHGGLGVRGAFEYGPEEWTSLGLDFGLAEYIAPSGQQDMKSAWMDLTAAFFPWGPLGSDRPYIRLGFGLSPYIGGLFEDYWPDYASRRLGRPEKAGNPYWTAQAALGYRFALDRRWALDLGMRYDRFWPPVDLPLQTLGVETGLVWCLTP